MEGKAVGFCMLRGEDNDGGERVRAVKQQQWRFGLNSRERKQFSEEINKISAFFIPTLSIFANFFSQHFLKHWDSFLFKLLNL